VRRKQAGLSEQFLKKGARGKGTESGSRSNKATARKSHERDETVWVGGLILQPKGSRVKDRDRKGLNKKTSQARQKLYDEKVLTRGEKNR